MGLRGWVTNWGVPKSTPLHGMALLFSFSARRTQLKPCEQRPKICQAWHRPSEAQGCRGWGSAIRSGVPHRSFWR